MVQWLTQVRLEDLASSASQARCRQLNCFAAWVRLGAIFEADQLQLDQLIHLAFQFTTSQNEGKLCMMLSQHTAATTGDCCMNVASAWRPFVQY